MYFMQNQTNTIIAIDLADQRQIEIHADSPQFTPKQRAERRSSTLAAGGLQLRR